MSGTVTSRPVKVLLVGENTTGSCSLLRHLEDLGCHCLFPSSGKQALACTANRLRIWCCALTGRGDPPASRFPRGSSASVFRCHPAKPAAGGCRAVVRVECVRSRQPFRPSEFAQLVDQMIEEIQSQGNFHGSVCGSEVEASSARLFPLQRRCIGSRWRREMEASDL